MSPAARPRPARPPARHAAVLAWALACALAACAGRPPFDLDAAAPDARPDAPPTAPGDPCGEDEAGEVTRGCSGGQHCLSPREGFPNGYCAPDCLRAGCPEGSVCYPLDGARRYCVRTCRADADCRAREGYACRLPAPGSRPACLPNDAPVGRRPGGDACFHTGDDADAGAPGPYLAPLPRATFADPATDVSRGRIETRAEAEPSVAARPDGAGAAVAFMGFDARNYWRAGVTRVDATGAVAAAAALRDPALPDVLLPALAFDRAGRLHGVYVGNNLDTPGNAVRYLASDDGGASFAPPRSVFGDECQGGCDAPALAVGLAPGGAGGEVVYVAAVALVGGRRSLWVTRAPADAGAAPAFEAPREVATVEQTVRARRAPSVAALAAGEAPGAVAVAWVDTNDDNHLSPLGDPRNRVRLRVSADGGASWGGLREIARPGDAPVAQPPWLARAPGGFHAVYVTGGLDGAWDVVLASSRDEGASWSHRVVNDDPERCATHAFAGLAVDPASGDAHVVWLDNRYGPGVVAYARCPADPRERCGRNELVSDAPFAFTTARDATRWLGTRASLARGPDGTLWAAWTDTRTGGPAVYLARGRR